MSLEKKINTDAAAGESIFHIFTALVQFVRQLISERIRDGLQAVRDRGRHSGC